MAKRNAQRGAVTAKSLALILLAGTVTSLVFRMTRPSDEHIHYKQPGGDFAAQAVRREMIQMFTDDRVIASIAERDTILRLEVGPRFPGLAIERKREVVGIVCAYYVTENERIREVDLYDAAGKRIGSFSPTEGGMKLD
jgi:hypothetical protein